MIEAAVLGGIPLPALIVGPDERISVMNPAAVAMFGAAMLGRHHAIALRHPEVQAALMRALRQAEGGVARQVVPGPSQDAVHRVTVTPLPQGAGVLCVLEDLSEVEQIGQMRREFVANVSHELRSPLTALSGFIETLKGAAKDDPVARERFLLIMEREAGRMNRLIRDLLHLSRVEAEERVRPTALVEMVEILRSTKTTLRPLAEKVGVTVRLDIAEGLRTQVPGDADQLIQVFQNLMENAVKYGGAGGEVVIRLTPDSLPKSAALRIEVIDQGEGIDAQHLPRLTERFYRVDSHRSREKGGTGLGLAIVKHIVQRHRGRLHISSERGKGSTFAVILPVE
ncbi:GHKL domain-containing protein [Pseudotabrizicola sediminis]|uniref:histidine kinase n=1 Tax=Pseudotabrizicola sediminis TaxID=2486418 RepID=A0ABY2KRR6_9RHOB|nr:ATP-binding protein [Pseudotabrizicola sediminis]TGD45491.1 GHKL domain-containing protein [Pseudotabrizicola sediminis]